jgi:hypothetical protein
MSRHVPAAFGRAAAALCIGAALALGATPGQAASLRKLDEVVRGDVARIAVTGLRYGSSDMFVTALRDSEDRLRLMVWRVDGAGRAELRGNVATSGTIREVGVASIGERRFVTVLRDSEGRLRLIGWAAGPDGRAIERLDTAATDIAVTAVAAAAKPHTVTPEGTVAQRPAVFVAARLQDGTLLIQYWDLRPDGALRKESERRFGPVDVAAAADGFQNMLAMRDGDGELRLTAFEGPTGPFRYPTAEGGAIRDVRVALPGSLFFGFEAFTFSIGREEIAVRTGLNCLSGRLILGDGLGKLIGWKQEGLNPNLPIGRTRELQLEGLDGVTRAADLVADDGVGLLLTAQLGYETFCRALPRDQGKPRMLVTLYDLRAREDAFVKLAGTELGGDYTHIDAARIGHGATVSGVARFVVALRGVRGELKVTVWEARR